jgi:serine/threonine protein kinase
MSRERFIPSIKLERMLTYQVIYKELGVLKSLSDEQRRELATYVYDTARRIFTILVLIDQTASILHFHRERIRDTDLPFKVHYMLAEYVPMIPLRPVVLNKRRRDRRGRPGHVMASTRMGYVFVEVFQRYQGLVLAPILSDATDEEDAVCRLHDESPLPLIEVSSRTLEGGLSTVHRARIEPRQQNFKHTPVSRILLLSLLEGATPDMVRNI